jgi:hypothetical protein
MKKKTSRSVDESNPARAMAGRKPLFALISQVLVSYTVELDNAFENEKKMSEADYAGAGLSWTVWAKVMKFVGESICVEGLSKLSSAKVLHLMLGCLRRLSSSGLGTQRRWCRGEGKNERSDRTNKLVRTGSGRVASLVPALGHESRLWCVTDLFRNG